MTKPDPNGDLVIAICPDCNCHSVCDPGWMNAVGTPLTIRCSNCMDESYKPHQLVQFTPATP